MPRDIGTVLFVALLAAVSWCSWLVLKPFLPGMIWGSVLVVTFMPLHQRIVRRLRGRTWAASTVVTAAVAAFVIVPAVVAAVQVVQGGIQAYAWVQSAYAVSGPDLGADERWPRVEAALQTAKDVVGLAGGDLRTAGIKAVKAGRAILGRTARG